jgi:hypothetical protein
MHFLAFFVWDDVATGSYLKQALGHFFVRDFGSER